MSAEAPLRKRFRLISGSIATTTRRSDGKTEMKRLFPPAEVDLDEAGARLARNLIEPADGNDQVAKAWCAPTQPTLPVRPPAPRRTRPTESKVW